MGTRVPLLAIPNQELSMQLDGLRYGIRLRDIGNGLTAIDVSRAGVPVITGMRCNVSWFVLPYRYQEAGNFVWTTPNGEVPRWEQFGVTHFLDFVPQSELDAAA